jgi:CBS domain-containing protein
MIPREGHAGLVGAALIRHCPRSSATVQSSSVAWRWLLTGASDLNSEGGRIMASERNVRDIMVQDVVSIEPAASLTDAARAMEEANVGMLPVVQDGKVLGVITDRDIVVRAVAREADPAATAVGDCLSINAIVAHPDWSTEQAMQTMAQAQVGRLPVLDDDDQLVGVVTLSSLAFRAPEKEEALETAQEVSRRSAKGSA